MGCMQQPMRPPHGYEARDHRACNAPMCAAGRSYDSLYRLALKIREHIIQHRVLPTPLRLRYNRWQKHSNIAPVKFIGHVAVPRPCVLLKSIAVFDEHLCNRGYVCEDFVSSFPLNFLFPPTSHTSTRSFVTPRSRRTENWATPPMKSLFDQSQVCFWVSPPKSNMASECRKTSTFDKNTCSLG